MKALSGYQVDFLSGLIYRKLFVPQKEAMLIAVDQARYKGRFYQAGVLNQSTT